MAFEDILQQEQLNNRLPVKERQIDLPQLITYLMDRMAEELQNNSYDVNVKEVLGQVDIRNLDQIKLYLRQEISPLIKLLKSIDNNKLLERIEKNTQSNEVIVKNIGDITFPEQKDIIFPEYPTTLDLSDETLDKMHKFFMRLGDVIKKSVKITVPEPKVLVNIPTQPAPIINSTTVNLDRLEAILEPLSRLNTDFNINIPDFEVLFEELRKSLDKNSKQIMAFSGGPDKVKLLDSAGNIVNPASIVTVGTVTSSVLSVTTSSQTVLSANSSRNYAFIQNDSDTTIYLKLGSTATANQGIRLNANGSFYEINQSNLYKGVISAIHGGSGSKNLLINEGV